MNLKYKNPALLLIDIQKGFLEEEYWGGNRNNKRAEEISGEILIKWRELDLPIFHIRHASENPNSKLHRTNQGFDFNEYVLPKNDEIIITKSVNSAFIGTNLENILDQQKISTLVIVGLTTDHCVSTTTRMAGNYGYDTYIISDATATFDRIGMDGQKYNSELVQSITLSSLNNEFATVLDANQLFQQL